MKTSSYFVEIIEKGKYKYIKRRKRKGIKPYARTLSFKKINKILLNSNILYPKLIRNHFNFVDEEYILPTEEIKNIPKHDLLSYFINTVKKLNNIDINKYKKLVSWSSNSEFILFQVNNFKKALKLKGTLNLEELDKQLKTIDLNMDDNRKLSFIHGDLHSNNVIINNGKFYLIDWEMATIGDLAYELATHFILMNYSKNEETIFINEIVNNNIINKEKLVHDINEYKKFELIRRKTLRKNTGNHFH